MGICMSAEEKAEQIRTSRQIDGVLKQERKNRMADVKLLLLGSGECGKTTVLKQMKILHQNGFTDEEIRMQKTAVFTNCIQFMADILTAMQQIGLPLDHADNQVHAVVVLEENKQRTSLDSFTGEVFRALKLLWRDAAVQEAYNSRHAYHLPESAKYFFDSLERINAMDYRPTEQDILYTRVRTTGIVEVKFLIKSLNFRVVDVGGQRSERRKWIHCFQDVNGIIFISAINEYDQILFEDNKTDRSRKRRSFSIGLAARPHEDTNVFFVSHSSSSTTNCDQ